MTSQPRSQCLAVVSYWRASPFQLVCLFSLHLYWLDILSKCLQFLNMWSLSVTMYHKQGDFFSIAKALTCLHLSWQMFIESVFAKLWKWSSIYCICLYVPSLFLTATDLFPPPHPTPPHICFCPMNSNQAFIYLLKNSAGSFPYFIGIPFNWLLTDIDLPIPLLLFWVGSSYQVFYIPLIHYLEISGTICLIMKDIHFTKVGNLLILNCGHLSVITVLRMLWDTNTNAEPKKFREEGN